MRRGNNESVVSADIDVAPPEKLFRAAVIIVDAPPRTALILAAPGYRRPRAK